MDKPSFIGCTEEQIEYIEELERLAAGLLQNGAVKLMSSLNKKMAVLADKVDDMDIDLEDKDDKTLDRFIKMATAARGMVSDYKTFHQEYGPQIKVDETMSSRPLIERMMNK